MFSSLLLSLGLFGSQPVALPVHEAFRSSTMQGRGYTLVRFDMPEHDYYLYQDRFTVTNISGQPYRVQFMSQAEMHKDEFIGETFIFRDQAFLKVFTHEPFSVSFQGCKEATLCYPPTKIDVNGAG
ncbi:protein-disulfide reductase DsbD domain-containing protein [Aliidiomarina quisquiliarum]|uniref:protein-disulfide reductase DsbD domain-containing protein n=1 Tax=Aliidiomarina quisquiliarum TaxID=2938947 RepID=UPI00208F55FF|nr:protein-disulfide reductase DsbD domain-containing protein [Aliidiomarina quisquiliarum]MCO4319997.1 hypothetical protein [Aliidiomarina quisquiliarum]